MKKVLLGIVLGLFLFGTCFGLMLSEVPSERCITIHDIREDSWISEIDEGNNRIDFIIQKLIELDRTNGDIRIYMHSPGGYIRTGLGLIDVIKTLKNDIQILVHGEASSMGLYILAVGTKGKRVITKHTEIFIHRAELAQRDWPFFPFFPEKEIDENGEWTEEEQEQWWEERYIQQYVKDVETKCDDILFEHTKVTPKELADWNDTFIYADTILKYGIADGIYEGEIE